MNQTTQTMQSEIAGKVGINQIPVEENRQVNTSLSPVSSHTQTENKKGTKNDIKANNHTGNNQEMQQVQPKGRMKEQFLHVPPIIEFSITVSWAILVTAGVLIGIISFKSGVKGLEFFLRTGSAVFLSGLLLVVFNWIIAQSSYDIHKEKMEKEKRERESEELFNEEYNLDDMDEDFEEFINGEADDTENEPAESEE